MEDEDEIAYVVTAWNYVEGAMDVSNGIPQDAGGVLGRIREAGKLRVATEPYFPPQEYIDPALSGQARYVGADMELARLIAQRMGVELEIVPMEFTRVLPSVAEGECDLAISALSYTPSRAVQNELSKGYHYAENSLGSGIMIREADADIHSIEDLKHKIIAAQRGSVQELHAAEHIPAYLEFRRLAAIRDVYQALSNGDADAVIVDIETAQNYFQTYPNCGFKLLPGVNFRLESYMDGDRIAGKKGELQLMYFVNGVINEVLASGQYEQWFDEYTRDAARLGL